MLATLLNTTLNGTQPSGCHQSSAEKLGLTFTYCLLMVASLAGNTFIGIIVYRTESMRKPINFLIVNMAMSDLLFAIFLIPLLVQLLYKDSWLIGGLLGQILCKLVAFFVDASTVVSIQSLVLIAVDRFGAVVYPLRSPLISSKLCPFVILATWVIAMAIQFPELLAFKLVEFPGGLVCSRHWNEAFGESSSFANYFATGIALMYYVPFVLIAILYIIIYVKLKSQKIQRWTTTPAKGAECVEAVHCYCVTCLSVYHICHLPCSHRTYGLAASYTL